MTESLGLQRRAALRQARERGAQFIVECVYSEDVDKRSIVETATDRAAATTRFQELVAEHAGMALSETAARQMLAEGGFYGATFKVRLDSTQGYQVFYDLA